MTFSQRLDDKKMVLSQLYLDSAINMHSQDRIITLIREIYHTDVQGQLFLLDLLLEYCNTQVNLVRPVEGMIFDLLLNSSHIKIVNSLNKFFPTGIVSLESACKVDYSQLQQLLIQKKFQKADLLTQRKLCEISRKYNDHMREWLYFTDIMVLPPQDLLTIDRLWLVYSQGLFGISVQRKIWTDNGKNCNKLWDKIGWLVNDIPCRYPNDFIWDTSAPQGHLPLFNQLRGYQVLLALFNHPVWDKTD